VYGDLSFYSGADSKSYIFSFSLDLPDSALSLRVVVNDISGRVVDTVNSYPSTFAYPAKAPSSSLKGTFVLAGAAGNFLLNIIPEDDSGYQFTSLSTAITILDVSAPKPPPEIASAKFDNSGASMIITFDSATDSGSTLSWYGANSWLCSYLFSFIGASDSTCSWLSSSSIKTIFGVNMLINNAMVRSKSNTEYLLPGGKIMLLPGKLKAFCKPGDTCKNYKFSNSSSTTAMVPDSPMNPTVVLTAPSALSVCENLTIDATASYGIFINISINI
jgi:hypothetical protein